MADNATADALSQLIKLKQSVDAEFKTGLKLGDVKAIKQLSELSTALGDIEKLQTDYNKAKEEYLALDKEGSKSDKETLAAKKKYIDLATKIGTIDQAALETQKKAIASAREFAAREKEIWQNTTILGKAQKALSSELTSFVAKLGFAAMAGKALGRIEDAAVLRQTLMIKGYQKMNVGILGAAVEVLKYEAVLRSAQATADKLGISQKEAGDSMEKFSRIVGTKNVAVLGALSEASMAVSKELGIDVAEATDFVSISMNKMGTSATAALVTLDDLRSGSEEVNSIFGTTVLRADDVSRTLIEIGRNESIYAMDQRAISNVLRDNITRLQSMGDSYDIAYKKAKGFTEGLTTNAPKWMKLLSGQDIMGQLGPALRGGKKDIDKFLNSDMAKAINASNPKLAKQIAEIYTDPKIGDYSKSKLIQGMLAGTKVGINSINDQMLKLADAAGGNGVSVIAEQMFGGDEVQAKAAIDGARELKKLNDDTSKIAKLTGAEQYKALMTQMDTLQISKDKRLTEAEFMEDTKKTGALDQDQVESLLRTNNLLKEGNDFQSLSVKLGDDEKRAKVASLNATIANFEAQKKGASEYQKNIIDQSESKVRVELANTLGKTDEQQLDVLKEIRDKIIGGLPTTPGGELKSKITEYSSPEALAGIGTIVGLVSLLKGVVGAGATAIQTTAAVATAASTAVIATETTALTAGIAAVGATLATALAAIGSTLAVIAAGLAGYGVGKALNWADSKTGDHVGGAAQWAMNKGSHLLGGDGIISDADAMAQGAAMVKPRSPTALPGAFPSAATTPSQTPDQIAASSAASATTSNNAQSAATGTTPANGNSSSITGQVGALQPDGSVMVKLVNFMDAVGQGLVMAKQAVPRGPSK